MRGKKRAALGLAIIAALVFSAPASAHDAVLEGSASCNSDGTRSVTWTYNAINVPAGAEAEVKIIKHEPTGTLLNGVDAQLFLSVWSSHSINQPGVPTKTGNWSQTFTQTGFGPLDTEATIQSQGDWNDGASDHDPTLTIPLPTNCVAPTATPTPTVTPTATPTATVTPEPTVTPTEEATETPEPTSYPQGTYTPAPNRPAPNTQCATGYKLGPIDAEGWRTCTLVKPATSKPHAPHSTTAPQINNPKELAYTNFDPTVPLILAAVLIFIGLLLFLASKDHEPPLA